MREMAINLGVIRDRAGIYSGLRHSRSSRRQLAICYRSEEKLLVKICTVKRIIRTRNGTIIRLFSPDDPDSEISLMLEDIESIYPIREFFP